MRNVDYTMNRAKYGDKFENEVVKLLIDKYKISSQEAKVAFHNCMTCDYAVILPISKEYPNGVLMATDVYRQKVVIG